MKGHASDEIISDSFELIRNLGKFTFDINFLKKKKSHFFTGKYNEQYVRELIKFLFQFSVIGNIFHEDENPSKVYSYSWAHREDIIEPDYMCRFAIHRGLRPALRAEK